MDDQSLHRYTITQINEHTYQLDDVLSKQTWQVEILKENTSKLIENLKKMENAEKK